MRLGGYDLSLHVKRSAKADLLFVNCDLWGRGGRVPSASRFLKKSSAKTFNIFGCSSSEAGFFAPAELKKSPTVVSS